ncbi:MAG: hypothetical protein COA49_09155 [Bacteroidetes bacterium]|nr:MAG: hypothetical protein COA49_09155 [Bacteroidota bacterium]
MSAFFDVIVNSPYALLLFGLVLLVLGGETLVRNSSGLAIKAKIPALIVGLTIVAIGTSSPELFASMQAAWHGSAGIAVGNVVGSNIANLCLALGLTALVRPLKVDKQVLKLDWPILVVVTLLFGTLALDGVYSRLDGVIFLLGMTIYMVIQVKRSRRIKRNSVSAPINMEEFNQFANKKYSILLFWIVVGCILLYYGAGIFVDGAAKMAQGFGISEHVIGVTIVAFGTSVPEIVASVTAALKGQSDLGIGSLIGSNIMNILLVLGVSSTIVEIGIEPDMIAYDFWWMLGTTALLYPILTIGKKINRLHGAIYLTCYVVYIWIALG